MKLKSIQKARTVSKGQWVPVDGIEDVSFVIKPYQRGFRWEKKNVRKLLNDLEIYKNRIDVNNLLDCISVTSVKGNEYTKLYDFYCLQALSVKKETEKDHTYELIDGQQRLTTLLLIYEFLWVFLTPLDERSDSNPPFRIIYKRDKKENGFDLSEEIHKLFVSDNGINGISPKKAYMKGSGFRNEEWFSDYKIKIKNEINNIRSANSGGSLGIDLYYIGEVAEEIIDFVKEYKDDTNSYKTLTALFDILRQDVLFLWYEVPVEISAEEEFTSLNANKINLTNAELIKALVLSTEKDESKTDNSVSKSRGQRWEAIEQGLCRGEFWSFISDEERATRIDFLLELYALNSEDSDYQPSSDNEYALFDWFESKSKKSEFSENVLKGLEDLYNRINEWYEDVDIYHLVGLLTCFRRKLMKIKTQEKLIQNILLSYNESSGRNQFIENLKEKIKQCILYNIGQEDKGIGLFDFVCGLSYDDGDIPREKIKAVLWLLNAWEIIESAENNPDGKGKRSPILIKRLPFSRINAIDKKDVIWSLEHIMPQHPSKDDSQEIKNNWKELEAEIGKDKAQKIVVWDDEVHEIRNLTLLTEKDNTKVGNGNLEKKRGKIIDRIKEGAYIPESTLKAFSLYYNKLNKTSSIKTIDRKYWTDNNSNCYLNQIKDCLEYLDK